MAIARFKLIIPILLLVSLSSSHAFEIKDEMVITLPPNVPVSPLTWLLERDAYQVLIERTISVDWPESDTRSTLVLFLTEVPPPGIKPVGTEIIAPANVNFTYSYSLQRTTIRVPRKIGITQINISYYIDTYRYAALFGRVQLGWRHVPVSGIPYSEITARIKIPRGVVVNHVEPRPSNIEYGENEWEILSYSNLTSGFLYFEEPTSVNASLILLSLLVIVLSLFILGRFSDRGIRMRAEFRRVARNVVIAMPKPKSSYLLSGLILLCLLFFGLCFIAGPSPRLDVVVFHDISKPSISISNLNDLKSASVYILPTERQMELMDRFNMIDLVVVESWLFSTEGADPRLDNITNSLIDKGTPFALWAQSSTKPSRFNNSEVYTYTEEEELQSFAEQILLQKKRANFLRVGGDGHNYLAASIGIFSLFLMTAGCFIVGILSINFKGDVLSRTFKVLLSLFILFMIFLGLYLIGGHIIDKPIGWHGPSGAGITVLSLLGDLFGGGNWLRLMASALGFAGAVVYLVYSRRIRISFSLVVITAYVGIFFILANSQITPLFIRTVSGEAAHTPPTSFASNRIIDSIIESIYNTHYAQVLYYMTGFDSEVVVSNFSRGIALGLAIAGFWAIIHRVNYATNSLFLFPAILVIGRFYTRVGDLDVNKSLFVFPAGIIGGCIIALAAAYIINPVISTLTTHKWIASRGRGLILAAICTFISLPLMTIGITDHQLIIFLAGSLLLGIALLTMENSAPGYTQQIEESVT